MTFSGTMTVFGQSSTGIICDSADIWRYYQEADGERALLKAQVVKDDTIINLQSERLILKDSIIAKKNSIIIDYDKSLGKRTAENNQQGIDLQLKQDKIEHKNWWLKLLGAYGLVATFVAVVK